MSKTICKCGREERQLRQRTCRLCHAEYMVTWRARQPIVDPRSYGEFSGVYFVRCEAFIKIGVSDDVRARFRALLSASPYELIPLGYIPGDPDGVDELEERLHIRFALLRHRGEWFRAEPDLLEFIAEHAQPIRDAS